MVTHNTSGDFGIFKPFLLLGSVFIGALIVVACGGSPAGTQAQTPEEDSSDPVSLADQAFFDSALGFYDIDRSGNTRPIRNDLDGKLAGMVQFAQSHTIDPTNNDAKEMPSLVTRREALLLFTPGVDVMAPLKVTAKIDGQSPVTLTLLAPMNLPSSNVDDGRAAVEYSKRAWSIALPWDLMRKGLSLHFEDTNGLTGTLPAHKLTFAAPGKLYVWGIRLGMLTDPQAVTSDGDNQILLNHPATGAADCLQTLPASQIIVASYETQWLTRVMVGSGAIYGTSSADNGDAYNGDMREDVAKATYSVGINQANYGVTSSRLDEQSPSLLTSQFVYHHAVGAYANGIQRHGLSGGNAIGTLSQSSGNEWSHEIGHHFEMGHYPGAIGTNYFWSSHHADSGWGYIAHRKRMRANLAFDKAARTGLDVDGYANPESFMRLYSYNADAMAGGWEPGDLSLYTHYTGYTARRIQNNVMARAWYDAGSSTGYSQYDAASGQVVDAVKTGFQKATRFGVPVFTLLGGYDPVSGTAVMYPPARANYGNVYDNLPEPSSVQAVDACWLDVGYVSGGRRRIAVAVTRLNHGAANKYHVNIAEQDRPADAGLWCRTAGIARKLDQVVFPDVDRLAPMEPPAVIGEAAGYEALATKELAELEQALLTMDATGSLVPTYRVDILLQSWNDRLGTLSTRAQAVWRKIRAQRMAVRELDLWMNANAEALDLQDPKVVQMLKSKLVESGWLAAGASLPTPGLVRGVNNSCMSLRLSGSELSAASVWVVASSACDASRPEQQWIMDAQGAIRNGQRLDACLTVGVGNVLSLNQCRPMWAGQKWTHASDNTLRSVRNQDVLDLDQAIGQVILYGYHGNANQQWSGLVKASSLLPLVYLSSGNVRRLFALPA